MSTFDSKHMNVPRHIFCLGGQENTLALARYAHRIGIKVLYFDIEKTLASVSRYVKFHLVKRQTKENLLSRLIKVKNELMDDKPFIFLNSDFFVRFAFDNRDVLEKEFHFMIPSQKIIECALDKSKMKEIFPIDCLPVSFDVKGRGDLLHLRPPVMVKPRNTSNQPMFKTKILNSLEEIVSFEQVFGNQVENFLFQELIQDEDGHLISIFFYRSHTRKFNFVTIERERMNPSWGGVGCLIRRTECDCIEFIADIIDRMDYVGLGEIDMFRSKSKLIIFDLNVRLPGWAFFAAKCGVDLIGMYLSDVSDNAVSVKKIAIHSLNKEIKAIDFINDIEVVFHPNKGMLFNRMLTIGQYVKSLRNVRYSFLFDLSDAKPFFYKIMKEIVNSRKI